MENTLYFSLGTFQDCANQVKGKQSSDYLKKNILHFQHYKKLIPETNTCDKERKNGQG